MPVTIQGSREFGPADDEAINQLQERINAVLPESYRRFLLQHNGGHPLPDNFEVQGPPEETSVMFLYGLYEGPRYKSIDANVQELGAKLLPRFLPIGYEAGGQTICLGLEGDARGSVFCGISTTTRCSVKGSRRRSRS